MLLVYGSMVDTPVTSLPFGLALLVAWERARSGKRVYWPLATGLALLAVLAGWQSLLLAAVIGAWALLRMARGRTGSKTVDAAFAGGALAGAVLLTTWLLWAFGGSLAPLLDQFRTRTGQAAPISLGQLLGHIRADTVAMFGVTALLGVAGLVVALANRRTRGVAGIAVAVTLPYPLVFRSGAMNHDYWNFWFLLPIGVGLAAGCDLMLRSRKGRTLLEVGVAATAAAFAVCLTVGLWARPDGSAWAIQEGRRAGSVARSQVLDPAQTTAWYAGAVGRPAGWLALAAGRPAVAVAVGDLPALAADHPRDLVLVGRMRCGNGEPHISYAFESAAGLAARPPEIVHC